MNYLLSIGFRREPLLIHFPRHAVFRNQWIAISVWSRNKILQATINWDAEFIQFEINQLRVNKGSIRGIIKVT